MSDNLKFSKASALEVGNVLGINWNEIDFNQFYIGMNVELEHGKKYGFITNVTNDDPIKTGRIALAHLYEIPDYYTRLIKMEKKAEKHSKDH